CQCLGPVGLDHHQPGALEVLLRIAARRLHAGRRGGRRRRFQRPWLLPLRFLAPWWFLVSRFLTHYGCSSRSGLLRLERARYRRLLVAPPAVPVAPMPAPAAPLLGPLPLRPTLLLRLRGLRPGLRTSPPSP